MNELKPKYGTYIPEHTEHTGYHSSETTAAYYRFTPDQFQKEAEELIDCGKQEMLRRVDFGGDGTNYEIMTPEMFEKELGVWEANCLGKHDDFRLFQTVGYFKEFIRNIRELQKKDEELLREGFEYVKAKWIKDDGCLPELFSKFHNLEDFDSFLKSRKV